MTDLTSNHVPKIDQKRTQNKTRPTLKRSQNMKGYIQKSLQVFIGLLCIVFIVVVLGLLFAVSNTNIIINGADTSQGDTVEDDSQEQDDDHKQDNDDDDDDDVDDTPDNNTHTDKSSFFIRNDNESGVVTTYVLRFNQISSIASTRAEAQWVYDAENSILYTSNRNHCLLGSDVTASSIASLESSILFEQCQHVLLSKADESQKVVIQNLNNCIHNVDNTWHWLPCTSNTPKFDILKL